MALLTVLAMVVCLMAGCGSSGGDQDAPSGNGISVFNSKMEIQDQLLQMAEKYEGKVNVVKCNVDDSTDIPMKFGIRNIPTLLFFKGGELVDRVVGAVPQAEIEKRIEAIL